MYTSTHILYIDSSKYILLRVITHNRFHIFVVKNYSAIHSTFNEVCSVLHTFYVGSSLRPRANWRLKEELTAELMGDLITTKEQTHCLYKSAHTLR